MSTTQAVNVGADELRRQAAAILAKPYLSKEDSARFDRLMNLADSIDGPEVGDERRRRRLDSIGQEFENEKLQNFRIWVRSPERRDLAIGSGGALTGTGGAYFVPQEFEVNVWAAAKAYDRLFDRNVVTCVDTDNGRPISIPNFDDTGASAQQVSENTQEDAADLAGTAGANIGALNLSAAPLWRAKGMKVSRELVMDNAVDLPGLLARANGVRFARGIGASFVTSLIGSATLGRTAAGASVNTGGSDSATNTIGTTDLLALIGSVDPLYANSDKAGWLMSYATLITILSVLDKNNRPVFRVERNSNGDILLYEKPVYISPSVPALAASAKTVLFGDLSRFIVRYVRNSMQLRANIERFAEYGQVYYQGFVRANGGLQISPNADSPVKYLQQHS